jgi:hypothetical protein
MVCILLHVFNVLRSNYFLVLSVISSEYVLSYKAKDWWMAKILGIELVVYFQADFPNNICTVNAHGIFSNQVTKSRNYFLNSRSVACTRSHILGTWVIIREVHSRHLLLSSLDHLICWQIYLEFFFWEFTTIVRRNSWASAGCPRVWHLHQRLIHKCCILVQAIWVNLLLLNC